MQGSASGNSPNKISGETRTVIRKRAMTNYIQQKRRKASETKHRQAVDLIHEIKDVDPFDAFPVKLEPYMVDLLKYCE